MVAALVARNVRSMVRAIDVATTADLTGILALHAELVVGDPATRQGAGYS